MYNVYIFYVKVGTALYSLARSQMAEGEKEALPMLEYGEEYKALPTTETPDEDDDQVQHLLNH